MAATIERLLVRIEADAAQLSAELAKSGTSLKSFSNTTTQSSAEAGRLGQRYANAGLQISSALEGMARAGKAGGEQLKQVVTQGSAMATMFGPQGAVVGAIGIASLAIVEMFARARREAEVAMRDLRAQLREIRQITSLEDAERRRLALALGDRSLTTADVADARTTQGDAAAQKLDAQRRGVVELRRSIAETEAAIRKLGTTVAEAADAGNLRDAIRPANTKNAELTEKLLKERAQLALLLPQLDLVTAKRDELVKVAVLETEAEIRATKARKDATQALSDATKQQQLAEQQVKGIRDIGQGFTDLFAEARKGAITLEAFDKRVRELGDAFSDQLKKPTDEQLATFKKLSGASVEVRAALSGIRTAEIAKEFAALEASLTPTVVDDFRAAIAALAKELTAKGFSGEQVSRILQLQEALGEAASRGERTQQTIDRVRQSSISAFDAQLQLQELLERAKSDLAGVNVAENVIDPQVAAIRIAGLRKEIEELQSAIKSLGGGSGGKVDVLPDAQSFASALSDAADFAAGVSTGLLGAESSISRMLAGVSQVASGLNKVADASKLIGGLGGNLGAALPGIAGIIAGIGALTAGGGRDAAEAQRHRENLSALRAIERHTGDLVGNSATGRDLTSTAAAVEKVLGEFRGADRNKRLGLETVSLDLLSRLTGKSTKDLESLARSLGITLDGTEQSFRDFLQQLKQLDLEAFTDDFAGQLRRLEIEARLDPAAFEGIEGLIKRLQVLAGPKGAPAISAALAGIDIRTVEGRAEAIEKLSGVLRNIGDLSAADLGDLTLDQFIEEILKAVEALRGIPVEQAQTAGEKFRDAIEQIALQAEFGVLTAEQRLAAVREAFQAAFGSVAEGLDFSSLDALKESVKGIIAGFDDDGELSDAERALAEALRELLGAFEATTPAALQFTDSLAALLDRFELLGISAKEQVGLLLAEFTSTDAIGKNAKLGLLQGLTDGLDVTSAEGLAALRARAGDILAALSAGGIDEQEQAVVDALKRILGTAERAAAEVARSAEEAARQDLSRRKRILAQVDQDIDLDDVEDPKEILRRRLKGFLDAFGDVLELPENFEGLSSEELDGVLASLIEQLRAMGDGVTLAGIPIEELISALLGLEAAGDSATTTVLTLAESIAAAFDGIDLDLDIAGITDPLERTTRKLRAAADKIPELSSVLGSFALDTEAGRKAAEAALVAFAQGSTDAGVKRLIADLLADLRGLPEFPGLVDGAGGGIAGTSAGNREFVVDAANITEVTANRLVDLFLRNVLATERIDAKIEAATRGLLSSPLPVLQAPALPSFLTGGTAGSGRESASGPLVSFVLGGINFNGPLTVGDADELGRVIQRRVLEVLDGPVLSELVNAIQRAGIVRAGGVAA